MLFLQGSAFGKISTPTWRFRTRKNLVKTASKHGLLPHWDYIATMCRISIAAIWDVIWGQTNLLPTSDRPPNPLSRKDQNSKNLILMDFALHQKPLYNAVKYLVRKATHKQKIRKSFFRKLDLSEFLPDFNDFYMKKHLFYQI